MTLDKIIYLSFLAGRVQIVVGCLLGALITTVCIFLIMGACEYNFSDYASCHFKNAKKYAKFTLATALLFVVLPSKWEVLSMTVTKGYESKYLITKCFLILPPRMCLLH